MKVALVYDRVNKWGGAERVLLALHKIFPTAPLYTSVYNPKKAKWAKVFTVKTSFLQRLPFASSFHELYAPLMPFAFENLSFKKFDVIISVTSESAKNIRVPEGTIHICYCLTPTRYLWSGYGQYFKTFWFRLLTIPLVAYLRKKDLSASQRPDVFVAISKEVQRRIKKYYHRESGVIYPPIAISPKERGFIPLDSGYFLIVSRLVPYKKIDLAIKVCNQLKYPLKIIGTGSEERLLRKMAGPTVQFLGTLTDQELVGYYRNCRALLFCAEEDLGLSVIEAQRFGKPVVAYKRGGALETVVNGKTGMFFYPQSVNALAKILIKFNKKKFNSRTIEKNSSRFSEKQFTREIKKVIIDSIRRK